MKAKAIIIGTSTAGKTTILKYLSESSDLILDEMDDALTRMNNGVYPKDGDHRHKVLIPRMVQEVLRRDSIVFFANTHAFTTADLGQAKKIGFKIIQLHLPREMMESRNQYRMKHQGYDDVSMYFKYMIEYQEEIKNKGLVDVQINTDQPFEIVVREVMEALR